MYTTITLPKYVAERHEISSKSLKRTVSFDILFPDNLLGNENLHLLLLNDGQDMELLDLRGILSQLYIDDLIDPVIAVAVHAGTERVLEYGVAGTADFKDRGRKASLYNTFILNELLPFVESLSFNFSGIRAFAGWSLGGLTALDMVLRNASVFDVAGVFSGAFWWRTKDLNDGYTDNDRIMHQIIRSETHHPGLRFWIMTGTEDEITDRNRNHIIDSIDDSIDVIKELVKIGYRRPQDIAYYEAVGGQHNVATWAKAMPSFLIWAFAK